MFCEKIIDDSNFVPNRLLLLHPTRAVTLPRNDFKVEAEQIGNINKFNRKRQNIIVKLLLLSIRLKIFVSKPHVV